MYGDLYHKSKLTMEKINNINTVMEIRQIFYCNEDWYDEYNVTYCSITKRNISKYKKLVELLFLGKFNGKNVDEFLLLDKDEIDNSKDTFEFKENNDEIDEIDEIEKDERSELVDEEKIIYNVNNDEEIDDEENLHLKEDDEMEGIAEEKIEEIVEEKIEENDESDFSKITGTMVYGYTKGFDKSILYIKEDEASLIRTVFQYENFTSLKIVETLNKQGILKEGKKLTQIAVDCILRLKHVYTGEELHRGVRFPKIIEPNGKNKIALKDKIKMPRKLYGYYITDAKTIEIKEDEARIIRLIFLYKHVLISTDIAKKFNEKGFLKSGEKFTKAKILRLFKNEPIYKGQLYKGSAYPVILEEKNEAEILKERDKFEKLILLKIIK